MCTSKTYFTSQRSRKEADGDGTDDQGLTTTDTGVPALRRFLRSLTKDNLVNALDRYCRILIPSLAEFSTLLLTPDAALKFTKNLASHIEVKPQVWRIADGDDASSLYKKWLERIEEAIDDTNNDHIPTLARLFIGNLKGYVQIAKRNARTMGAVCKNGSWCTRRKVRTASKHRFAVGQDIYDNHFESTYSEWAETLRRKSRRMAYTMCEELDALMKGMAEKVDMAFIDADIKENVHATLHRAQLKMTSQTDRISSRVVRDIDIAHNRMGTESSGTNSIQPSGPLTVTLGMHLQQLNNLMKKDISAEVKLVGELLARMLNVLVSVEFWEDFWLSRTLR